MKTIYCIGDSFTAGTELADKDYYGSLYPGYLTASTADDVKRAQYREWWFKNTSRVNISGILNKKEKEIAWPSKLGNILQATVTNAGCAGKSMQYIADTMVSDIIKLNHRPDLVIVQFTDPVRLEFTVADNPFTLFLTMKLDQMPIQEQLRQILLQIETDKSLYHRWLMQIVKIKDFCDANNIPLLLVDSINVTKPYLDKFADLSHLESYISQPSISMMDVALGMNRNSLIFAAGGHFTEIVHDKFAAELSKIIQDRKLI